MRSGCVFTNFESSSGTVSIDKFLTILISLLFLQTRLKNTIWAHDREFYCCDTMDTIDTIETMDTMYRYYRNYRYYRYYWSTMDTIDSMENIQKGRIPNFSNL